MKDKTSTIHSHTPHDNTQVGANEGVDILQELEQLKEHNPQVYGSMVEQLQTPGGHAMMLLPTHLVAPSRWANRHADSFNSAEFRELKEAIATRGVNTQPIVVRVMAPEAHANGHAGVVGDTPRYEIVSGHRRHQACRELGLPVRAIVFSHMNDLELSEAMFDENNARTALTPWEAGAMYKRWLDEGLYPSRRGMAQRLGKDIADVSRALALHTLPQEVVAAFESPNQLQYKDVDEINKLLKENQEGVLQRALQLAEEYKKRTRTEVLRALREAVQSPGVGSTNTPRRSRLVYQNTPVAELLWHADGCARLSLSKAIPHASQARFEADVSAAIARALKGHKPHSNPKHEPPPTPQ
jgi:ParB family transcriptional regulator, chromosome partitioning protein